MDREIILIQLFCDIDNFCQEFEAKWNEHLIGKHLSKSSLHLSEIITLTAFYHHSG